MFIRVFLFISLLVTIFCASLSAGQLAPDISQKISALPADQFLKVWIQLPPSAQAQSFRSSAAPTATAVDLHRNSLATLKQGHAVAQASLVGKLESLALSQKVRAIRPHWLINVVEAEVAVSELTTLAGRTDIDIIYSQPIIALIRPTEESAASSDAPVADSVTDNLKHIRAPQAWAAGYTGAGRLICSFDTGIEGAHPALQNSWRGRGGTHQDSVASWFDPKFGLPYPHTLSGSLSPTHGTHTMGIMVGKDLVKNITYGVAPDAKWISAGVIDIAGASIIDAFEWAADPDGDPNTIDDVPDVINHSWGYRDDWMGCENVFYDMIDATEALGIVNIFAAGNSGPGASTIYNPANRGNDSLDCFSVGMINLATPPAVDLQSSRGPSSCNLAMKPNVVAPGVTILSTIPGSQYAYMTGTSMAAPHVAGLVALLREKNPAATVTEIKRAILTSTQRYSWTIPATDHGWGEIDCLAAVNALPAAPGTPKVRLYDFVHNPIAPGSVVTGKVVVQNVGGSVSSLTGTIVGTHPLLSITDGSATFGTVGPNVVDTSNDNISVTVSDTVSTGTVITVPFNITNGSYSVSTSLAFVVEPRNAKSIGSHTTSLLKFSVSNFGVYGLGSNSLFPIGGMGFNLDNLGNDLWESGLMISTGPTKLSSGVHSQLYEPNMDFRVSPGGNLQFDSLGGDIDEVTWSRFTDLSAPSPIGLEITQQTFTFGSPYEEVAVIQYVLRNPTGATISNLKVGLFTDWDLRTYTRNAGGWETSDQFLWTAYNSGTAIDPILSRIRGTKLLEGTLATAATSRGSIAAVGWEADPTANGFLTSEKYALLNAGISNPDIYKDSLAELLQLLAAGPITLAPGQLDTVVFAVFGGPDLSAIKVAAAKAPLAYALVAGLAPSVATQISPANNAVVSSLLPSFSWHASHDPNPNDVVTYTFRYGSDPGLSPAAEIHGLTDTTYTLTDSLVNLSDYYWQIVAVDNTNMSAGSAIRHLSTDISTDVPSDGNGLPRSFTLYQNYPNPFNPSTVIAFELPRASEYLLTIYDMTGRELLRHSGLARAGRTEFQWDARGQSSGIYLYRLTAGDYHSSRKMLLLK